MLGFHGGTGDDPARRLVPTNPICCGSTLVLERRALTAPTASAVSKLKCP